MCVWSALKAWPFRSHDHISNSLYCLPFDYFEVGLEKLLLDQMISPCRYIFFYSHHLSAWHCINIVRRNSVLVTPGIMGLNLMDFNRKLKQKKNYLISKSIGAFSLWIIHFVSVDGKTLVPKEYVIIIVNDNPSNLPIIAAV